MSRDYQGSHLKSVVMLPSCREDSCWSDPGRNRLLGKQVLLLCLHDSMPQNLLDSYYCYFTMKVKKKKKSILKSTFLSYLSYKTVCREKKKQKVIVKDYATISANSS